MFNIDAPAFIPTNLAIGNMATDSNNNASFKPVFNNSTVMANHTFAFNNTPVATNPNAMYNHQAPVNLNTSQINFASQNSSKIAEIVTCQGIGFINGQWMLVIQSFLNPVSPEHMQGRVVYPTQACASQAYHTTWYNHGVTPSPFYSYSRIPNQDIQFVAHGQYPAGPYNPVLPIKQGYPNFSPSLFFPYANGYFPYSPGQGHLPINAGGQIQFQPDKQHMVEQTVHPRYPDRYIKPCPTGQFNPAKQNKQISDHIVKAETTPPLVGKSLDNSELPNLDEQLSSGDEPRPLNNISPGFDAQQSLKTAKVLSDPIQNKSLNSNEQVSTHLDQQQRQENVGKTILSEIDEHLSPDPVHQLSENIHKQLSIDNFISKQIVTHLSRKIAVNHGMVIAPELDEKPSVVLKEQLSPDLELPSTDLNEQLSLDPDEELPENFVKQLSLDLVERLSPNLDKELSPYLDSELSSNLDEQLSPNLVEQLSPNLDSDLSSNLVEHLSPDLVEQPSPNLDRELSPNLDKKLPPNLDSELSSNLVEQLSPDLVEQLSPNLDRELSPVAEQFASMLECLPMYMREQILPLSDRELQQKLDRHIDQVSPGDLELSAPGFEEFVPLSCIWRVPPGFEGYVSTSHIWGVMPGFERYGPPDFEGEQLLPSNQQNMLNIFHQQEERPNGQLPLYLRNQGDRYTYL